MSKKRKNIQFSLIDITTEQFAVFDDNFETGNDNFEIDLSTRIKLSSNQKAVGFFTKYSFFQKTNLVLVIECGCHFKLNEDYWNDNLKDNVLTIHKDLLTHFLFLTVGTSRGVLHAKKPKKFENLILPTLNITTFLQDDISFDLSKE